MRHAVLTTIRIGLLVFVLGESRVALTAEPTPIDRARTLIAAHKELAAAELLEDALTNSNKADHGPILALLRDAYSTLAKKAQAEGKDQDAALYRDNLAILNREINDIPASSGSLQATPSKSSRSRLATTPALPKQDPPVVGAFTEPTPNSSEAYPKDSKSLPPPQAMPEPARLPPVAKIRQDRVNIAQKLEGGLPALTTEPRDEVKEPSRRSLAEDPPSRGPAIDPSLKQADHEFREKHYDEAGRLYARLAEEKVLPPDRKEAWAYCRWTEVVRRINAKPRSAKEWDAIESEIRSIRELNPNNWYGEYLLSRVAEARKARRSFFPSRSRNQDKLVVRGSQPEEVESTPPAKAPSSPTPSSEDATPRLDVNRLRVELSPSLNHTPAVTEGASDSTTSGLPSKSADALEGGNSTVDGEWQIRDTPNFRVFHNAPEVAERAAQIAESVRSAQATRWASPASSRAWVPKCEIYLYSDAKVFSAKTGQPEESPGFTMLSANGGKIIARRINLRVDHTLLLTAILPHEITHVVLADLFPNQPVPRWADEGIAVLSEPPSELDARSLELIAPLQENRLFTISDLIALDYPESRDWSVYYAQSVSLTRFLVDLGQPKDFVRFLQASQRSGFKAALRNIYRISDLADLQNRWLAYVKDQTSKPDVANTDAQSSHKEESELR